jgi:hypothetical protein
MEGRKRPGKDHMGLDGRGSCRFASHPRVCQGDPKRQVQDMVSERAADLVPCSLT